MGFIVGTNPNTLYIYVSKNLLNQYDIENYISKSQ